MSLRAFDKGQYGLASLSGMVAATTRMFGLALIPTFLIRAWQWVVIDRTITLVLCSGWDCSLCIWYYIIFSRFRLWLNEISDRPHSCDRLIHPNHEFDRHPLCVVELHCIS